MREVLFKAKRVKNGEWIEGSLIDLDIDSGYYYIVPPYKGASTLPIGFYVDWTEDKCLRKDLGYWIDMVYAMPVGNIFDNPELLQEEH
jgi:hypothetical protein